MAKMSLFLLAVIAVVVSAEKEVNHVEIEEQIAEVNDEIADAAAPIEEDHVEDHVEDLGEEEHMPDLGEEEHASAEDKYTCATPALGSVHSYSMHFDAFSLTYFDGRGLAEVARTLFATVGRFPGHGYEDVRVTKEEFSDLKDRDVLAQNLNRLPILQHNELVRCAVAHAGNDHRLGASAVSKAVVDRRRTRRVHHHTIEPEDCEDICRADHKVNRHMVKLPVPQLVAEDS